MLKLIIISFTLFLAAILLLSIGVIFKKKTPLKGSCKNHDPTKSCTCDKSELL